MHVCKDADVYVFIHAYIQIYIYSRLKDTYTHMYMRLYICIYIYQFLELGG